MPREQPESPESTEGPTLVIVDDDPDLRLYVRRCVTGAHGTFRRVLDAPDGESGLEVIRAETPDVDVVVCDVLMPGMGGFGFCRSVRADPATSGIPILLLTGDATSDDLLRRAEEAGADGVLLKPFNARTLRTAVEEVLRVRATLESGAGDDAGPGSFTPTREKET